MAEALQAWLERKLAQVPEGSATAKAILYSLRRWPALTRYLDDGDLPIDNNWVESRIRPIALGRNYPQLSIMHGCTSARASRGNFNSRFEVRAA